jgi:hypothetical protein
LDEVYDGVFKKMEGKEFSEAPNKEDPSFTELMIKVKASSDFISFPLSESNLFYLSYNKTLVKPDFISEKGSTHLCPL